LTQRRAASVGYFASAHEAAIAVSATKRTPLPAHHQAAGVERVGDVRALEDLVVDHERGRVRGEHVGQLAEAARLRLEVADPGLEVVEDLQAREQRVEGREPAAGGGHAEAEVREVDGERARPQPGRLAGHVRAR